MMKQKRVAIVGAGVSGLTACKHVAEKGFRPVVFEAETSIGGVWSRTLYSTKLQSPKSDYEFSDFPWPPEDPTDVFPHHQKVLQYLDSYIRHFDLLRWITFGVKVLSVEYVGATEEEMAAWELWAGNGEAFGSGGGKWHITVQHLADGSTEVHEVDFLILCMGKYSGVPNVPSYEKNEGPEVFHGQVLHVTDYGKMDKPSAVKMIQGKRVAVVGSGKTAYDAAAQCAMENGPSSPCTMICRTKHWIIDKSVMFELPFFALFFHSRFFELLVHKPGEGLLLSLLTIFLTPLKWLFSIFIEMYSKWKTPLEKHGMVPEHSLLREMSSCSLGILPDKFYDRVEDGSIILKKSKKISFCREGVVIDQGAEVVESDVVILATGFNGDQKLRSIFCSSWFQKIVLDPPHTNTLYRQCIHPRIPQLAMVGYAENVTNLHVAEMISKWIGYLLDDHFRLPSIGKMEMDVSRMKNHLKLRKKEFARVERACFGVTTIWLVDLLLKDMGLNPKRKNGFLAEWFTPYQPSDYANLLPPADN